MYLVNDFELTQIQQEIDYCLSSEKVHKIHEILDTISNIEIKLNQACVDEDSIEQYALKYMREKLNKFQKEVESFSQDQVEFRRLLYDKEKKALS